MSDRPSLANPSHQDLIAQLAALLDVLEQTPETIHDGACDGSEGDYCDVCREVNSAREMLGHDRLGQQEDLPDD